MSFAPLLWLRPAVRLDWLMHFRLSLGRGLHGGFWFAVFPRRIVAMLTR
jgi:hypothetical protein